MIFSALVLAALFNESHQIQNILVLTGNIWKGTRHPLSGRKFIYTSNTAEVWSQEKTQCKVPDFPQEVDGAVGFWIAQGPTVCGGGAYSINNQCYFFNNRQRQWMPWTTLKEERRIGASAIQIDRNTALIIGGGSSGGNRNHHNSTEILSSSGSIEGEFPVTIKGHCTFKINSTHGLITGGRQNQKYSTSTWYVDLTTTTFTPGPEMLMRRWYHGCATFQMGDKTYGIVSGGNRDPEPGSSIPRSYGVQLDSTEIIELDQRSPTWTEGPKLPRKLWMHTMVETDQGTFVMGGSDGNTNDSSYRAEVLQLNCPIDQIQQCQWREMEEKLKVRRGSHVSLPIPESYDICN